MAERTFPTAGISPIDSYLAPTFVQGEITLPAGYFGVFPTSSSYRAGYCNALYAIVDLGTGEPAVSGRTAVIEAKLHIGASSSAPGNISCLCLDWNNESTYPGEIGGAYILCRERSTGVQQQRNILHFSDITPATTDGSKLFSTDTGTPSQTHSLRFVVGVTPYWFMVTSTTPA